MLSYLRPTCFILCILLSYIESTTSVKHLKIIDYQGTLTTLNNRDFHAKNILIGGRKRCIKVFRAPKNPNTIITRLVYDPKKYVSYINLCDVKQIEVPYPYATWTYNAHNCRGKDKYLLIKVNLHDEQCTGTYYLIEPKRRIRANLQKDGSNFLTDFPFSGFKKCTVEPTRR